jgi:hypothetical protein
MGKSIRSKVKRAYRSKKREDSVYAATESARLERLHAKLAAVVAADKEGDVTLDGLDEQEAGDVGTGKQEQEVDTIEGGQCDFGVFGLVEQEALSPETLHALTNLSVMHGSGGLWDLLGSSALKGRHRPLVRVSESTCYPPERSAC